MSDYEEEYSEKKKGRKLVWFHNLGSVQVELDFNGAIYGFRVTPGEATVISKFGEINGVVQGKPIDLFEDYRQVIHTACRNMGPS